MGKFSKPHGATIFYFPRSKRPVGICGGVDRHLWWHCAYRGVLCGTGRRDPAGETSAGWWLKSVMFCFAHVSLCFGAVFLACPFVVLQSVLLIILFIWCLPVWLVVWCCLSMLWLCLLVCLIIKHYWTHHLSTTVYISCSVFNGKRHYLFFHFCGDVYHAFITLE